MTAHPSRRLKVAQVVEPRRSQFGRDRQYPALRLAGRWLAAAGFAAGGCVLVTVEDGRLVVQPAPAQPAAPASSQPAPAAAPAPEWLVTLRGLPNVRIASAEARAAEGEAYRAARQKDSQQ